MSRNLLKAVSWTYHTSYPTRQLFMLHIQYSGQKFQLLFVNTPVCHWRNFSRMKINGVSEWHHLLLKQIAFETPQKFCSEPPVFRPLLHRSLHERHRPDLSLSASTAGCKNFSVERVTDVTGRWNPSLLLSLVLKFFHQTLLLFSFF